MAKGDSMYDNKRSPKADAAAERKGEEEAVEKKVEGEAKESEGAKMADEEHEAGEDKGIEGMMDGFKKLLAAHESERRDHHNNHREALRQMASRHTKAIREHFSPHFGKMDGENAASSGGAKGEESGEA